MTDSTKIVAKLMNEGNSGTTRERSKSPGKVNSANIYIEEEQKTPQRIN